MTTPLRKNKLLIAVLLALVVTASLGLTAWLSVFKLWELRLADNLYQTREPSKDIVIVRIDAQTLNELGEFSRWSRANYAQTLQNILKQKPNVVAFDLFLASTRDTQGDTVFAQALAASDVPIVLGFFQKDILTEDSGTGKLVATPSTFIASDFLTSPQVIPATLRLLADSDETIRRIPSSFQFKGEDDLYLSFSLAIAKAFSPSILDDLSLYNDALLIHYATSPHVESISGYPSVSFIDVYNDKLPSSTIFKDKIVLLGVTSRVFGDKYFTPLSSKVEMQGVQIHANAIQTVLDGAYLRYLTPLEKIALIAFLAFASSFFFMFTRIRWSLLFLVVAAAGYTWAAFPLFRMGIIADMVHPYLTLAVSFVAVYLYRYLTEFREKSALKSAFGKYVNPTIAEKVAQETPESLKLGGAQHNITVLFTDIAHFTTISEQLTPESLVALLNEYLEAMSDVIMAENGTVDKFEGDAIMAFFGAPLNQPDHALRACRATLAMRRRLRELHEKWEQENAASLRSAAGGEPKPLIDFRAGLSSGDAIVGNVGSPERLEYTAMGDIVNLGSRLESANKKYSTNIMMSEATYLLVKDSVFARELDTIRVEGKKQPVKVFELLGMKEAGHEVSQEAEKLLELYAKGIAMYNKREFSDALVRFDEILKQYPDDGPSQLYKQRCEVLKDVPPPADWDGVFEMGSK